MKKLIALLLTLVIVLSMSACGKKGTDGAVSDTTGATGTTETTGKTDPDVSEDPATPNQLYLRSSYTAEPLTVAAARGEVIATLGGAQLTNGLFQLYYWMNVYDFLNTYAYAYDVDFSKPLDEQNCGSQGTWQHYFLDSALGDWKYYQSLALAANEAQIGIAPTYQEILDGLYDELTTIAENKGLANMDVLIQSDAGPGCTAQDYYGYVQLRYQASSYIDALAELLEITDDMIEEYFTKNEAYLGVKGIHKKSGDSCMVRHVLIQVTETKTDDDWESCRQEAQKLLDGWVAGGATEDAFSALAQEHSEDPGSGGNGGLYTGLTDETSFVQEFKDWYLAEGRKTGDYGLIKTSYGYHIMYFSGTEPIWQYYCREAVRDEQISAKVAEAMAKYEPEIAYDKILLGEVTLKKES